MVAFRPKSEHDINGRKEQADHDTKNDNQKIVPADFQLDGKECADRGKYAVFE